MRGGRDKHRKSQRVYILKRTNAARIAQDIRTRDKRLAISADTRDRSNYFLPRNADIFLVLYYRFFFSLFRG